MKVTRVKSTSEIVSNIDAAYRYTGEHGIYNAQSILGEILGNYFDEKAVIAESNSRLVGIAIYRVYAGPHLGIPEFAVVKQGVGIGTLIFNEIVKIAEEMDIHTIRLNAEQSARAFYKKLGFVPTGEASGMQMIYYVRRSSEW